MTRLNLFFFPYAGASASVYERWKGLLDPALEIIPVELPGRGRRFGESLLTSVDAIVEDGLHTVKPYLDGKPYAMFGHSLGCVVAFEMSRRLRNMGYPEPVHLFASGRDAPHLNEDDGMHLLPDDEFLAKIKALGGTPPEFFENQELLSLFLPILKSDYQASETYRYDESAGQLTCDFTVFAGLDDGDYDPMAWSRHTTGQCRAISYEGGHFFLHDHTGDMANQIQAQLLQRGGMLR